jgi:hypothetical protein
VWNAVRALFEPTKHIAELTAGERALLGRVIRRMREGQDEVDYDSFRGFDRRIGLIRHDRRTSFVMQ